jgi:outer membrane protein assembly factor BamB
MKRRELLGASILLGAVPAVLGGATARAESPKDPDELEPSNLGPAALAATTLAGGFVGAKPYVVSHLLAPATVGVFDPAASSVRLAQLPTGGGAWSSVVVGAEIYIGMYGVADLYRLDSETMELSLACSFAGAGYIWDLSLTADGKLYAGTYPDGKVWEYDTATGSVRDLGVALAGQKYVRSIIADDSTIYAGVGAQAGLVAIDRATGAKTDLTPSEFAGESFVYQLAQTDTEIIAGTHGTGRIAILPKADPAGYRVVAPPDVTTIGKMALDGTRLYFGAGDQLWRLDLDTDEFESLGVPSAGDFIPALHVRDGSVVAFTNSAAMWTYDIASGTITGFDFQRAGFPKGAELPLSLGTFGDDQVLVGGHGGVDVHPLGSGERKRIRVSGEPKAITAVGRRVYLAMYPSCSLVGYDPATEATTELALIGHEQNRPRDLAHSAVTDRLLIGTSPDYGKVGGALASYDLKTGELDVHRNVVEGHAIGGVAADPQAPLAYLGSEAPAAGGPAAALATFDLRRGIKIAEVRPIDGALAIPSLAVHDGVVYGSTSAGLVFALDPRTQRVLATRQAAAKTVDLVVVAGTLYGVSHSRLFRIRPRTLELTVLVDDLAADPASFALLAAGRSGRDLFTITGRDLLRITL